MLSGATLREVETKTGISNAYLSQLESGKADRPAPRILHKLAEFYGASYTALMEAAGYLQPVSADTTTQSGATPGDAAFMGFDDLTDEEKELAIAFVRFWRKNRGRDNTEPSD
jgi:transcriptional regulator with XRE-family HTH domain